MSNYIYHSNPPETPQIPDMSREDKKKGSFRRNIRIFCICLFLAVAALTLAAVLFLSGSYSSIDEYNDDNSAGNASTAWIETSRTDFLPRPQSRSTPYNTLQIHHR